MSDSESEPRVSWIYNLKKNELLDTAKKFNLDCSGTVSDLRQRVVQFLRSPEIIEIPSEIKTINMPKTEGADQFLICDNVRKWGLKFDGNTDAVSFLERLEELTDSYGYEKENMLKALPELFKGNVLLWYRNNKNNWKSWEDFITNFKKNYLPSKYYFRIGEEIRNRTQGYNEKFSDYWIALNTLIRRHGQLSNEEIIERAFENLRPEYKLYIRRKDFSTITDLHERALEFEEIKAANVSFVAPPHPSRSLFPETAFTTKNVKHTQDLTERSFHGKPVHAKLSNNFIDQIANYSRDQNCWRCGHRGHFRNNCGSKARLFCSFCGKTDILTRDCSCRKGNSKGPRRN